MKRKRIIAGFSIVIIISGVSYFYFTGKKEKITEWKTVPLEKGTISVMVTATGSINALTTVQVGTQVSGTISKLYADFNSVVKKGQLIAMLDTTFLAASRDDAEAALQRANVQLNQAKIEFDRIKKLFEGNAVAQADYDLALTVYESAQSTYKSAEAQYKRAKINLAYATIRAPISGVVISRNVDVGQTMISSFNSPTLFTIANDLTKMQVFANVDEADIGQIQVGQKASFTVDAYPNQRFEGEIKQIRLQPTVLQNVVNYVVVIDVPNPDLKLLPGLTANINVAVQEHRGVYKVQTNALHFVPPIKYFETASLPDSIKKQWINKQPENISMGNSAYVWIKEQGSIIPHRVNIGLMDGGYSEISGEIAEGDEIVTGINKGDNAVEQKTKNPFMPSMRPRQQKPS
jgi:HlyD family secretion protein